MSLLNVICKELGVELNEGWRGSDDKVYKINGNGVFSWYNIFSNDWCEVDSASYCKLLSGVLKPVWNPKAGECYYTPDFSEPEMHYSYIWSNREDQNRLLNHNLIFKTKEEAIECAEKALNAIKW